MLYILPNPGGMGGRGGKYPRRKYKPGKIASHGPGLPRSSKPTVWRPSARGTHPKSKTVGGRKIRKALGPGKHYRHRIVYWSRSPGGKSGDEGQRSPFLVRFNKKGNAMARRRKRSRKYGRRRNSSGLLLRVNKRRRHGKRRAKRNPFVLGNRRRSRRSLKRSNRRTRRARRNPFFYNRKRRRSGRRTRRNTTMQLFNRGRRGRRHYRRNPARLGGIIPGNLMSIGGITGSMKTFVVAAIPVGLGYIGVRLLDQYAWAPLHAKVADALKLKVAGKETQYKLFNTLWDTLTHVITASVGAGVAVRFIKRPGVAQMFAAGVAINWIRKIANIWVESPNMKALLAGGDDENDLSDYVQYDVPGQMADYVETNEGSGVGDYVESY